MKTIYQLKPNENKRNLASEARTRFVMPVVILLVVVVLSSSPLGQMTVEFFYSALKIGNHFYENIPYLPGLVSDRKDLLEENRNLYEEMEKLRLELADYETVAEENERLYIELGLKPKTEFVGAKIVGKPPQAPLDSILIDRGGADGIKIGDIVLASDRAMIGRIAKISDNNSIVALSSISGFVLYGYVERTGEPISAEGVGGGIRSRVPIDFDITREDKIVFEGSRVFLAARVASVEDDRVAGFKEVFLSLPASVAKIRFVFIEPSQKISDLSN